MNKSFSKPVHRKAALGVESLESREVLSTVTTAPVKLVPDYAGSDFATARVVNLPAVSKQVLSDYLSKNTDVDMYKVQLNKGDFLAVDVDRTGSVALGSSLAVFNSAGSQLAVNQYGTEPESGLASADPSLGFWAPADGAYYLKLSTPATNYSAGRGYALGVERITLQESQAASRLAQSGAHHIWLSPAGDVLNVTGPTGYGFSLRGDWTKTIANGTTSYSTSGTVYLKTTALGQYVGELPLQTSGKGGLVIKANTPGWSELGTLDKVSGQFGFSLDTYAGKIKDTLGVDLSNVALMNGWTIKTGAQIKQEYQNYVQREITQILDGVPYLVYGQAGDLNLQFGKVSLTSTDQAKLVLIADPADPFLYVGYKDYAFAGSMHGNIPFNTSVAPTAGTSISNAAKDGYFGHVFAAGEFPLSGLPATVSGDVTVDLDANDDGMFLGGAGNADQLFQGDLNALGNAARDIQVGVNGAVNLGYSVGGYQLTVPVGEASLFYSGPQEAVWFKGVQGSEVNTFRGTILEDFQTGPGTKIEGFVYRTGQFSVATTSSYKFMKSANAALTLTVTNNAISAKGQIHTPVATLDVNGAIDFHGNFTWTGSANVNIGGGNNYVHGAASFLLTKTATKATVNLNVNANAKFKISGAKAQGKVTGSMTVTIDDNGHVSYSANLRFKGNVYYWNAVAQGWRKLGSFNGNMSFSGSNQLSFKAFGRKFSISL